VWSVGAEAGVRVRHGGAGCERPRASNGAQGGSRWSTGAQATQELKRADPRAQEELR
jgi:hypothetical protein